MSLFPGFEEKTVATNEAEIFLRIGGSGPALLLLHGFPQTGAMWAPLAQRLAQHFTLVIPDLPGYGRSSRPEDAPDHAQMSKRRLAEQLTRLMGILGFDQFRVVGHDRGARVTHRLCLDHPARVTRAAILDIVPTRTVFETINQAVATAYYHWFFLIQPAPLPEWLIRADPDLYFERCLGGWGSTLDAFAQDALAEYRAAWRDPAMIHCACEDYRAAAGIDLVHDRADAWQRIACPLLVLWGAAGIVGRNYDVPVIWGEKAGEVQAVAIPGGHFLVEESPVETLSALLPFLQA